MAISVINLGADVVGEGSGVGGDKIREAYQKINQNFTNKDNAASRIVGQNDDQLPTVLNVKRLTSAVRRTYLTLSAATADISNMTTGSFLEIINDNNPASNRLYRYNGTTLVAMEKTPLYISEKIADGVLFALTDAQNNATWLQVSQEDGGLTDVAESAIRNKLGLSIRSTLASDITTIQSVSGIDTWLQFKKDGNPTNEAISKLQSRLAMPSLPNIPIKEVNEVPLLFAGVDAQDNLTDFQIDIRGEVPDSVMRRWHARLRGFDGGTAPSVGIASQGIHSSDTYLQDGLLRPILPDSNKVILIGSSSGQRSIPAITTELKKINSALIFYTPTYSGATIEDQEAVVGNVPLRLNFTEGFIRATGNSPVTTVDGIRLSTLSGTTGFVSGVRGTLNVSGSSLLFTIAANRSANVPVSGTVEFVSEQGQLFRNAVQILWVGKNNLTSGTASINNVDQLLAKTDDMIAYSLSLVKRTVIMTHFVDTDEPVSSATRSRINYCNLMYKAKYGNNVFDVEPYLLGAQIFTDLGIPRTQADINAQNIGNLAPSLAADRVHCTLEVYAYLAQKLRAFIDARDFLEV